MTCHQPIECRTVSNGREPRSRLRLGERQSALGVFDMMGDPEAMTQFIHRCRDRGVRPEELLELLKLVSTTPPLPQE